MNWYKKAQQTKRHLFPSDEEWAYYNENDEYEKNETIQEMENEELIENSKKRFAKWRKIYIQQKAIERLKEQLKNKNLNNNQIKKINLQIGKHRGAISNLHNR